MTQSTAPNLPALREAFLAACDAEARARATDVPTNIWDAIDVRNEARRAYVNALRTEKADAQ